MKKLLILSFALSFFCLTHAQVACPYVTAVDDTVGCGTCATLTSSLFGISQTTNYTVSTIPYTPQPFTGGTAVLINIDDTWSGVITLPFPFCFYGNTYTQCVIGSNGIISFNTANANGYCNWSFSGTSPIPSTTQYPNSIMGPYHDIDPGVSGSVSYQILGSAPCRRLVVNWNQVPMFQCNNLINTQQTVLYETTNVIETYIANKPICNSWNSGLAIHGIQNATATAAVVVPGRNLTAFSVQNEGTRFTPSGGALNYTQTWYLNGSPIGSGNNVQVCPNTQTDYVVEVVYNGCAGLNPVTVYDTATIYIDSTLNFSFSTTDVTCFGANNGTSTALLPPSTSYQYSWTPNVSTTGSATGLAPGNYSLTAIDTAAGCMGTETFSISSPTALSITTTQTNNTCFGQSQGTATAIVGGGSGSNTYTWNTTPIQNTATATNLSDGTYIVTVHDLNNCEIKDTVTILTPQALTLNIVTTPALCNLSNGTATATVAGGTSPFTYLWDATSTPNASFSGLTGGNHTLTVTDSNGCTISQAFVIAAPIPVSITNVSTNPVNCNGNSTGSASVTYTNGATPIVFGWSGGTPSPSGASVSNLLAGNYSITLTDQNGCTSAQNFTIVEPPLLTFAGLQEVDILCFGNNTGSANATALGGAGTLQYAWTPNVSNTGIASALTAGTYSVVVSDTNNCSITHTFTLTEPTLLTASSISDTICIGQTGVGSVIVNGGAPNYSYAWTPPVSFGNTATGLAAGNYSIVVTDANGCSINTAFVVSQYDNPIINGFDVDAVDCFGANTGKATALVTNGTPPYQYNWNPPVSGQATASNLPTGFYDLTVVDFFGCSTQKNVFISQPNAPLSTSITVKDLRCYRLPEGEATVSVQGGTSPYTYTWSGSPIQYSPTATQLMAGTYNVLVKDANNCIIRDTATLAQPTPIVVSLKERVFSFCGLPNASITVEASQGTGLHTYSWATNADNDSILTGVYAGQHTVYVTDEALCQVSKEFGVGDIPKADAEFTSDPLFFPNDSLFADLAHVFFDNLSTGAKSYKWVVNGAVFSTGRDAQYNFQGEGTYNVSLVAYNGSELCPDTVMHPYYIVPLGEFFIPNAFSPNSDGHNDYFFVGGHRVVAMKMSIFDRWGKLITELDALNQKWDGQTSDGQSCPEGVYVYKFWAMLNTGQTKTRAGTITLIR